MITDDRVAEYYHWVLSRIKETSDTSPSNKPLRYELSHVGAAGVPNNETEENIVRKLDELGVVKITREFPRTWEYNHNGYFELQIIQPYFDNLCKKYGVIDNTPDESVEIVSGKTNSDLLWQLLNRLNERQKSFINLPEREFFLGCPQELVWREPKPGSISRQDA